MEPTILATFLSVDLLLVLTPGADWAFAIATGLRGRGLVAAVAGLVTGYAGYTLLAVAGLVVILVNAPGLLTAVTVLGAIYLAWLGWTTLRQPPAPEAAPDSQPVSNRRLFLRGLGISGLNPKAILLFFSLFPQFIDPDAVWPVAAQTATLGLLHMIGCAVVYYGVGALARVVLGTRPAAARAVTRTSGALMIGIGGFLLFQQLT